MPAASIFLFFSAAICVVLALYGHLQRRDAFTRYFIGLMVASALYALSYGLEIASSNLDEMKLMLRIEYLGIPFLSITWLGMAWAYLDPNGLPRRYRIALLLPCLATLFAFQTNDTHRHFYTALDFARFDDLSVAVATKGPLYWLHIAYLNLCITAGILLFVRAWRQSMRIYRAQALCILIGSLFPWTFHLLYLAGLSPHGIDLSPFGLAASGVLFAIASFRHGILDILPVARDLVFDGISEGVIVLDEQDRISDFNRAAADYVAGLSTVLIGKRLADIPAGRAITEALAAGANDTPVKTAEGVDVRMGSGNDERIFEVRLTPMIDRAGGVQGKALLLLDITEKRRLLEQLEQQAHTDPLTGLLNRRQLETEGHRLILLAERTATPLSLALIDVDKFKDINDTQGHHAGDKALRAVAALLIERLRITDIIGRIGGDEFVALLPGTGATDAVALMDELRATLHTESGLTLSIGVTERSAEAARHPDLASLLAAADTCLYDAKRAGRNRVVGPIPA